MPGASSPNLSKSRLEGSQSSLDRELRHDALVCQQEQYTDRRASSTLVPELDDDRRTTQEFQTKTKKKKRKTLITANLSCTRYEVVKQMVEHYGFTISKDDDPSSYLIWNDSFVSTERISELKVYQRLNHFPGMGEICRKDCLARNMTKMAKVHPEEFNFMPKTWIFPSEYTLLQNYAKDMKKKKKSKTYIVKPSNGAMGNGISLYRNAEKIQQADNTVVQEYLDKPLLIDGYKCDMRIYVLVTSCDPLRIFLYNDGLLRISTEKYIHPTDTNVDHLYMHLTNYSVNKHSEGYEKSGQGDTGSKRSLKYFNEYLRKNDYDVAFLWRNITDMIVKTMLVSHPHVLHAYRMCRPGQSPGSDSVCFEILGFDIMLDRKLRPWLLEINRSPSFGTDEKLDLEVKTGVVGDTLRLLNIKASDKRKNLAAQKAQTQKRLLKPTKRIDTDVSELDKKRQSVVRKKEELKDLLQRIRKEAAREDFENRNCGRFKRIFPPDDKLKKESYIDLLSDTCGTLLCGRASSLHQEIQRVYKNKLKEEDILDMLAQCEIDEKDDKVFTSNKAARGPKPLCSMPVLSRETPLDFEEDDDEESETNWAGESSPKSPPSGRAQVGMSRASCRTPWGTSHRPGSGVLHYSGRPNSRLLGQRSRAPGKQLGLHNVGENGIYLSEEALSAAQNLERDEKLTKAVLVDLKEMRIKFPGKTHEEADYILDKLHENWKFYKPRIASYWLVKLDSIKRRKVIDIVKSNVRAVLQRIWKCSDVDSLKLYRIFIRVCNRMLWSHGQGLWNCFQTSGNSWETIFSKSSESIAPTEMDCCRRIVELCRDCLLIVYQFAADTKGVTLHVHQAPSQPEHIVTVGTTYRSARSPSTTSLREKALDPQQTISQRLSRLYHSRSQSMNSLNGPS